MINSETRHSKTMDSSLSEVIAVSASKSLDSVKISPPKVKNKESRSAERETKAKAPAFLEEGRKTRTANRRPKLKANGAKEQCTCASNCEPGASNIRCAIHGTNPEYCARDGSVTRSEQEVIDVGAETIGAIKEYHGHQRFDINGHVRRAEHPDVEDEVMRTAINGVLHMGGSNWRERKKMKELADKISSGKVFGSAQKRKNKKDSDNQPNGNSLQDRPSKKVMLQAISSNENSKMDSDSSEAPTAIKKKIKKWKSPDSKWLEFARKWEACKNDVKCLCRLPRPKPERVPSHRLRCRSLRPPPSKIAMPLQPPPLGYRWSYRRFAPDNEKHKMVDHRHYITPPFKWVLVPTNLNLKKKKSYNYLKEAKYGYRNQMEGAKDFAVKNYYNFPPYCYTIVEPLRFPYENFNSPPFPKRAPLHFIHGEFNDKISPDYHDSRVKLFKNEDVKLTKADVRRLTMEQLKRKRANIDTEEDAWAGYKPKFIKSPIDRVWKYRWQSTPSKLNTVPETKSKTSNIAIKSTGATPVIAREPLIKGQSIW